MTALTVRTQRAHNDWWLLAAVGVVSLADSVTTWVGLHSGNAHESNGVMRSAMDTIGLGPVLALRVLLALAFFGGLLVVTRPDRILHRVTLIVVAVVAIGWVAVVANNIAVTF